MIDVTNRLAKTLELNPYCHHAKPHDFIEVTEWINGEGFDVHLSSTRGENRISLTYGEWSALQVLASYQPPKSD